MIMATTAKKQPPQRSEKRRERRVASALPVSFVNAKGVTRDVSASGIYFVTEAEYSPGNNIELTMELEGPAGKMQLKCEGEIVRIERHEGRLGVAIRITDSILSYSKMSNYTQRKGLKNARHHP